MKIKNPRSEEEINIYSARLTFTKKKNENGQVKNMVHIVIRYSQRGPKRKKDLEVPKDINIDELEWRRYKGRGSSEYRRTGNSENYDYAPKGEGVRIPAALRHQLEGLVKKTCFEKITRYKK